MGVEFIGAGVALVVGGIAAWAAIYQIGKQARLKLKLEVYREILALRGRHGDAVREASTKLHILQSQIPIWADPQRFGGFSPPPNTSCFELTQLVHAVLAEAANIAVLTEQWQIIDSRLDLFRLAMGSGSYDVREALTAFMQPASAVLPQNVGAPAKPISVGSQALKMLQERGDTLLTCISRLDAWGHDFEQEMQNLLLSDLFRHSLPPRKPIDPSMFAVRLDRYDEQKRHFERTTGWGRQMLASEIATRTRLQGSDERFDDCDR